MLIDSAFLLLIGLILAGLLHLVLNQKNLVRLIGQSKRASVFRAAMFGIPLPLCSCSVLPAAKEMRQSGAGSPATVSFLISTPESGVDSILLTYSLTDPLLTIARPITAFLSATAAGLWEAASDDKNPAESLDSSDESCCDDGCGCSTSENNTEKQSWFSKIINGVHYAFTDLLSDLAPYLLIGYVLAGLVAVALGDQMNLPDYLRSGWGGYLGAIIVGLPLYICATSSTPLAAALLGAGFSPGAILVFLLVGPATNIASLVVVSKILSKQALVRYLVSIIVVAVLCGLLLDQVYGYFDLNSWQSYAAHEHTGSIWSIASAVILSFFVLYYSTKKLVRRLAS